MKLTSLLTLASVLLLASQQRTGGSEPVLNPSGFAIHRGTNISHWLSQDFGWAPRDQWFTEDDVRFIASQGFDHVRLPLDEQELWSSTGTTNEQEFARLNTAIDWCLKAGLQVIIDLHTLKSHHFNASNEGRHNTLWTDPSEQEHFLSLWKDLSRHLHDYPANRVAYEMLNEPVADHPEQWNQLILRCYTTLRALEPKRVFIIGANRWQMPENLPFLEVPKGDRNIILSFHTYVPLLLTHYKADWVPTKVYTGPVHYPGPIVDQEAFDNLSRAYDENVRNQIGNAALNWGPEALYKEIEPALRRANELGLQLYCGEFGCLPTVPRASRLAYYKDITTVFAQQGVAYANWEYKGDFGVYEWLGLKGGLCGKPDKELISILVRRN